jgi:hypothetical protein
MASYTVHKNSTQESTALEMFLSTYCHEIILASFMSAINTIKSSVYPKTKSMQCSDETIYITSIACTELYSNLGVIQLNR